MKLGNNSDTSIKVESFTNEHFQLLRNVHGWNANTARRDEICMDGTELGSKRASADRKRAGEGNVLLYLSIRKTQNSLTEHLNKF